MKAYTLEQFEDRTSLLPFVVADVVSRGDDAFCEWAERRTVDLYNRNERWRKMMHRKSRREWLYAFMEHWHKAYRLTGRLT